jgi:epoxyqueuosine reductase
MSEVVGECAIADLTERVVHDFIDHSPANSLGGPSQEPAFCNPLVGYADGADPLFRSLKEHAGAGHWTPAEAFALGTGREVPAEELTVISWVLCQTPATKADNSREERFPSERWARVRIFGQQGNDELHKLLCSALAEAGVVAVAPALLSHWRRYADDDHPVTSTWSERHVAYVAGLGTFGLCGGLITARGKAVRLGSVVAHAVIPHTPRPYLSHTEYCLFYSQGICGACAKRCPVGSVSVNGRDKTRCIEHLDPCTRDFVRLQYGFDGHGCGLCQTGVPCESRIPGTRDKKSLASKNGG